MFESMSQFTDQIQLLQKMMKDENFRKLIDHPKVRQAMQDAEVQEVLKSKNIFKMMDHPKFLAILQDPELTALASKLKK